MRAKLLQNSKLYNISLFICRSFPTLKNYFEVITVANESPVVDSQGSYVKYLVIRHVERDFQIECNLIDDW